MCRWLAYSGSSVLLEELLYKPEHSLIVQSMHSTLGAEATNGDGFGVGWYGDRETPGVSGAWSASGTTATCATWRPHQLAAGVRPHPCRNRLSRAADELPPLPHGRWLWMPTATSAASTR